MKKKEILSLLILLLVMGVAAYRYYNRSFSATKTRFLLDTFVEISATSNTKSIGKQIDSVFSFIESLESKLDEYDDNSWISKFNSSEAGTYQMDSDVFQILCIADSLYKLTEGSFDISIKPVFDLWGFGSSVENPLDSIAQMPPDSMLIKEKLALVGFDRLIFNEHHITKPSGFQISLGAIAKGYILDQARKYMQSIGLDKGYISCRSSMTLFGLKTPQIILIQDPRNPNQEIASFKLSNSSVGTSGDYQQYFEHNGVMYHHILNAHTGYPVQNTYSVTVIHPSAGWADGLSTALFTLDPIHAVELAKSIASTNAVIYCRQGQSLTSIKTKGMQELSFNEKL